VSKKDKQSKEILEPTTAELLVELGTFDEVEVTAITDAEHRAWPKWTEVVLLMRRNDVRWPLNYKIPMTRHDGELIIEILHTVLHPQAGGSIVDKLWSDLDDVIERIMRRVNKGRDPLKADMGEARGLTRAIAMMTNPYEPNEEVTKGIAMDRYAVRHGLPTDSEDD
jgi:hypothetical protein